jgi:hypothetical protein
MAPSALPPERWKSPPFDFYMKIAYNKNMHSGETNGSSPAHLAVRVIDAIDSLRALDEYAGVFEKYCWQLVSIPDIMKSPEMVRLRPNLPFSEENYQEIYNGYVHYWGFNGPFSIDYFIVKLEGIQEDDWCMHRTEDGNGRKDVNGHCGTKRGDPTLSPEAQALNVLIYKAYYSLSHVNDGVLFPHFGSTPKSRVVNALKQKWLITQELEKPFPDTKFEATLVQ